MNKPSMTNGESRDSADPHIGKVLQTLEAFQAYDDARRARGDQVREGEVDLLVGRAMFEHVFDDWGSEAIRALVLVACQHAPASVLEQWAEKAAELLASHHEMLRGDEEAA
jgi:hypothetical protein